MRALALLFLTAAAPAFAAERAAPASSALVTKLVACKDIADNTARLACFDAGVARLAEATAKGDVKVVDRADIRATRRSLFGFALPKLPLFTGDDSADDTPDEVEATIAAVRAEGYGKFVLTMTDGALWRSTEALPRDPKIGGKVTLKRAALGSYFMRVGGGRPVRAQRVG